MRILGPAIIDWQQQRAMEKGSKELFILRDQLFPDAAQRAEVGDLIWVKEPYWDVQSGPTGPKHVHETVPGSWFKPEIPVHLKPHWHELRKKPNMPAATLRRGDSRATLRIMEIRPAGFCCAIFMRNVDSFQRRWVA